VKRSLLGVSRRPSSSDGVPGDGLKAKDIRVYFSGVRALDGVDLALGENEILGLIGPNGAGKTTLVNVLSGFQRPTSGRFFIGGRDVSRWTPHRLARIGLARTFQNTRLFGSLTVLENVQLGGLGVKVSPREARVAAWDLLDSMDLTGKADVPAGSLPYGDERRLAIVRALASRPRLLLLDEPAAGLNESESSQLVHGLLAIRDRTGCGLLVIEHDMGVIMRLCERIQVLDYGRTISLGTPAEVRSDPAVLAAYLGTEKELPGADS
jgi:branched-chain amino acid transport system ATP-binding protein